MHRFLTNAKNGEIVDHINNDREDNRLSNLRISNPSSNCHNKIKGINFKSKYIGVSFDKKSNKNVAQISKNKIKYSLGSYETEEMAAKIRDSKALELYGPHAKLNTDLILL
jgi:hypothetical protein